MSDYDVIVAGLGAAGSAALYQFAKRGVRVLGLDRYMPPHDRGSSHGESRITRLAIGEGAYLTPLVRRSHEIWREMEAATGRVLMRQTGGLIVSSACSTSHTHVPGFFANTVAAAQAYGIVHETLDARAIRARFPQFRVADDEVGYFEPEAGMLDPEACVAANLELAAGHGAAIRTGEPVLEFTRDGDGVMVRTAQARHRGGQLVLAAGPWLPRLLEPRLARIFAVTRQTMYWFAPAGNGEMFEPGKFPVFIWEPQRRQFPFYGFPALRGAQNGIKLASEQTGTTTAPDTALRSVDGAEIRAMHENYIAPFLNGVSDRCVKSAVCLYTSTPDAGFVIDRLPGEARVIVASPCSGHGFKHSAALGEALAELATAGGAGLDIGAFGFARFLRGQPV